MYDEMGNVNNVLEVQEYVPEKLDSLSGFLPPPSPPSSYNQVAPLSQPNPTKGTTPWSASSMLRKNVMSCLCITHFKDVTRLNLCLQLTYNTNGTIP